MWGDPDHDRCLTSLNMTLQSVVWQLEQDETGTEQDGITRTRRAQMSRFINLLRQYIQSQCDALDVATGGFSLIRIDHFSEVDHYETPCDPLSLQPVR